MRPFSGSFLKVVAVVTMLIDHIGAGIVFPMLMNGLPLFSLSFEDSVLVYRLLRMIGRTAFPVFCFLLVEGFFHTGNRKRYFASLVLFALLSEIPFDLALIPGNEISHTLQVDEALRTNLEVYSANQNVYCTLFIGLAAIRAIHGALGFAEARAPENRSLRIPYYLGACLVSFLAVVAACVAADLLCTDYGHTGVILIVVLYLLRRIRPLALGAAYTYISLFGNNEIWSLPGFLFMLFYNGKRGFIGGRMKYAFYAFYPVHLIIIYLVRTFIL